MADLKRLKEDMQEFNTAAAGFLPPGVSTAISILPTLFNIIANLVGGDEVEFKDVDWDKFMMLSNTAARYQEMGFELTHEEIRHILGKP